MRSRAHYFYSSREMHAADFPYSRAVYIYITLAVLSSAKIIIYAFEGRLYYYHYDRDA